MKRPILISLLMLSLLTSILAGCNLPARSMGAAIPNAPSPTPALPVTVIPNQSHLPTVTLLPAQPDAPTQMPTRPPASPTPTDTQIPASDLPPTATPTPLVRTAIPSPTGTSTPNTRSSAKAAALSTPPNIDGRWDDWTTAQYPIKNVVLGGASWTGGKDLLGAYRVGWDSSNLYLAVKVTDDTYVQNASGADLFKGDSIEVLFSADPKADSANTGLSANDYQIGISPGRPDAGENLEAYRWYPQGKAGSLKDVKIGAVASPDGYRVEFAIPWSVFGATPAAGQVYGFAVSVSDNDNKGQNLQQTLISSAPKRELTDPTTWGLLTLE